MKMGQIEDREKRLLAAMASFGSDESSTAHLKLRLARIHEQRLAAVNDFVARNFELDALLEDHRAKLNEFDLFETLNLWWREEIHSRALGWLLDPQQNHRLGDSFLKGFLGAVGSISAEAIDYCDWSASTVEREWSAVADGGQGYLDILVVNTQYRILCAIENKVFAEEGIGEDGLSQLTHYRKALENDFPDFSRHYVFLSPKGRDAYYEEERKFWMPVDYGKILRLTEQAVAEHNNSLPDEVRLFLIQYVTTIRRNIVPESDEIQKLARKIYLEHREVVELLKQNEPNWVADAKQVFKEAVAQQSQWKLDVEDAQYVRFRPVDWDQFHSTQTGTGWSGSESLILFQFRFWDSKPWLDLGLSAGSDEGVRERLFETARQHPGVFRLRDKVMKDDWMVLHEEKDYILDEDDFSTRWDDGSVRTKIMDWVSTFAGDKFLKLNEIIVNCLRDYEQGKA